MVIDCSELQHSELMHHGIKGMHWGIRRYQKKDGTYTALGKEQRRLAYIKKFDETATPEQRERMLKRFDNLNKRRATMTEEEKDARARKLFDKYDKMNVEKVDNLMIRMKQHRGKNPVVDQVLDQVMNKKYKMQSDIVNDIDKAYKDYKNARARGSSTGNYDYDKIDRSTRLIYAGLERLRSGDKMDKAMYEKLRNGEIKEEHYLSNYDLVGMLYDLVHEVEPGFNAGLRVL